MVARIIKCIKFVLLIGLLVGFLIGGFRMYYKVRPIEHTLVVSFSAAMENRGDLSWFSLRSPEFGGFFDAERLFAQYGIDESLLQFDFEQYTYVITIGHSLHKIEYSFSEMKNRKWIVVPKQFIGIVTLNKTFENKIYVYAIPKMDIDCDYHMRSRNITFIDDLR